MKILYIYIFKIFLTNIIYFYLYELDNLITNNLYDDINYFFRLYFRGIILKLLFQERFEYLKIVILILLCKIVNEVSLC